ncbi:hypothetical protein Tco_0185599 [Tanacetum coccineum]
MNLPRSNSRTLPLNSNTIFRVTTVPVIIAKELECRGKSRSYKGFEVTQSEPSLKTPDIREYPNFDTHKFLGRDYNRRFKTQRRVNLKKIHDVIKKEVEKLLDAGLIYPISNRWCACIDYRKLNEATHKDHFPLPFMDQMLERLAGNEYYCFLDGFSGYFQIPIDPHDQEKTTFTCPYGTFAYRRMSFSLCNAPGTFMDNFSVFGNSFENCLSRVDKMLQRCEDTNLCLNWEKSHFMVKEGILLGHKISKNRIEVDKAKVDVIAKLPYPTTVKGVRSFLGHADFY